MEGRGQGDPLLAALGSSLVQFGINVNSAQQENDDGQVFSVFKVTTKEGKQVPKVRQPLGSAAQTTCVQGAGAEMQPTVTCSTHTAMGGCIPSVYAQTRCHITSAHQCTFR